MSKDDFEEPWHLLSSGRIPMAALIQTLAVAEFLNLRHASNALGVNQSAVSTRIRTLEKDLGISLFERHVRGVTLTDAGKNFVDGISTGLEQINFTLRNVRARARGETGRLRIGVHALIDGGFLVELFGLYRKRYPNVDLEIAEGTARESVMQIRADTLDLTFVAGRLKASDCHSRQLWSERLLVALPKNHALAASAGARWEDLRQDTFLVRRGGTGPEIYETIGLRLGGRLPAPRILRCDVERMTLLSMVANGYGVTIVSDNAMLMPVHDVRFLPLIDEAEPLAFSVMWSRHNLNPALSGLLEMAFNMAKARQSDC